MTIGTMVIVMAAWAPSHGRSGVIVGLVDDEFLVLLSGDSMPIRFGPRALVPASEPGPHIVAGD